MIRDKDKTEILRIFELDYIFNEDDNEWDIITPQKKHIIFIFNGLENALLSSLKEYVYATLFDPLKEKPLTIYKDFLEIKKFLKYISDFVGDISRIASFHIIEYIDELEMDESGKDIKTTMISLKKFFTYYDYKISKYAYNELERTFDKYINTKSKSSSFHLMPTDFYDSLVSQMIKDRDNKNLSYEERAYACVGIIESQIGLRSSELMNLEHQAIIGEPNLNIGNEFKYLIYKTASKTQKGFAVTSFLNPLALKSWAILHKICVEKFNSSSNLLIDIPKRKYKSFQDYLTKFCLKHHKLLLSVNNSWYNSFMHTTKVGAVYNNPSNIPDGIQFNDILCYPVVHQFRVYRIHYLISHGVDINEVAKTVGHFDNQMTFEYTRATEQGYQELRKEKYGCYSKEMLGILSDIAKQKGVKLSKYIHNPVPNGICVNSGCERRENIIKNFK